MTSLFNQIILRVPEKMKDKLRDRIQTGQLDRVSFVREGESTKFKFYFENEVYPARLVKLPCNVENIMTTDNSTYYKSADISQLLIVYEDEFSYKADRDDVKVGPNDFYANGITPPTRNIVRRKFLKARPPKGKYEVSTVTRVEDQILKLRKAHQSPIHEVYEEIVNFEPWMLDAQAAVTGRVAGICHEVCEESSIEKLRKAEDGGVLFGHKVLAYHPEAMLIGINFSDERRRVGTALSSGEGDLVDLFIDNPEAFDNMISTNDGLTNLFEMDPKDSLIDDM